MTVRTSITPCLVYADAPAAIEFLCKAFGFAKHLVVAGENEDEIVHAQLVLDGAMIMLSSARQSSRDRFGMVPPSAVGGLVTSCLSVTISDPDAHYRAALAGGAPIVTPPHDNDFGGRGYEAKDLEGNVWAFGSYDPWAAA